MRTHPVALTALALSSCMSFNGPWSTGRLVTASSTSTDVTKFYKHVMGQDVEESTGTRGFGDDCTVAAQATGTSVTTSTIMRSYTSEAVGNTYTDAPIVPGVDTFNDVAVSVIAEQTQSMSERSSVITTFDTDGGETVTRNVTPQSVSTFSRYFGLAADEFLVELYPLNMFTPLQSGFPYGDTGDVYNPSLSRRVGEAYLPRGGNVELLTRRDASTGDVWTSLEGRRLYRFAGTEDVTVGDITVGATKVEVFNIENIDPTAASVIDNCLFVKEDVSTSSDEGKLFLGAPDTDTGIPVDTDVPEDTDVEEPTGPVETTNNVVLLDGGCEQDFLHQQVGTEWWYQDTLVKSETTTWEVQISDYGYEWFEEDAGSCSRSTSTTEPTEDGVDAKLFVTYSVTESKTSYQADSIGTVDAE